MDFSKYKSSASEFFHDPRRWFQLTSNNAFLELLLQIPLAVMETTSDSRRVIDVQLKTHCHSVINTASDMIIMELAEYISKAENATAAADFDLAKSEALKPETMQNFAGQAYKKLTRLWPEIKKCFDLYIGVKETEEILLQPIKKKIIDTFTRASVFANKYYDEEQKQIASLPTQEHIWLFLEKSVLHSVNISVSIDIAIANWERYKRELSWLGYTVLERLLGHGFAQNCSL
ncbi:unnamed protein product [Gongylonema pulchrum]|uniref:Uncharacterized protein n=1 Tax=Gongylonema pulchrum TaxID=637853 RepID=A0A3P7MWH0_9BILA|nr:unnamed protein product [Gongylonema pulchrum]